MTSSRRNSQSTWGFGGQRARCNLGRWKASGATTYSNLLFYSCPQVVWWVLRSLKFADPARLGLLADVGGLLRTERTPLGALKREPIRAHKAKRESEREEKRETGVRWGGDLRMFWLDFCLLSWDRLNARSLELLSANNIGQGQGQVQVPGQITCAEDPSLNRVERAEQLSTGTSLCEHVVVLDQTRQARPRNRPLTK